ncbi:cilia- and flagella-associated protein 251-like isoform X2 [Lytechinus variegatus]|uniref:cilia- and flagella-associated protein 251-like isoform X2 n=1 Tax=Lytechinus variegatus TaxID=7654 RepID=UPI001BB1D207|nr:cilia- and flagella-associated protein 251-like isoform X2 [Lytechinus variegatus]
MAEAETQPPTEDTPADEQEATEDVKPSAETGGEGDDQVIQQTEETQEPAEENTNNNAGNDGAPPADEGEKGEPETPAETLEDDSKPAEGGEEAVTEEQLGDGQEEGEPVPQRARGAMPPSPAEEGQGQTEEEKEEEEVPQRARGAMPPSPVEEGQGGAEGAKEEEEVPQRARGSMPPPPAEEEEEIPQRARGTMPPAPVEEGQGGAEEAKEEEEVPQRARGTMPPAESQASETIEGEAEESQEDKEPPNDEGKEQGTQEPEFMESPAPQVMPNGIPIPPSAGPPLPNEVRSRSANSAPQDYLNVDVTPNALNMTWSFGVNKYVPAINLTDQHRKMVIYVCGNTAVLCSYDKNTQKLLQGHCNNITCICASQDKRWVATADKGENSMIIIWDTFSGTPVQTIFDPHPDGGVVGINMTHDAKYIVTLSAAKKQTLSIWDWTTNGEYPVASKELGINYGQQTYVMFNPEDHYQIVSNSPTQVIFYKWGGDKIEFFAPLLTDQDFNRVVGNFSQSIFCHNSTRALTATAAGNVVVWDNNRPTSGPPNLEPSPNKKAFKLVRLQERGITVLTTTDRFVVTGDALGHVKFYDLQLRMSNWYSELNVGPINSVSFSYVPDFKSEAKPDSDYPKDATIHAKSFVTRDYIVSTSNAQVALVIADGVQVKMILEEHDKPIRALTTHPTQPFVVIGSFAGLLKVWNYETKQVVASRKFPRGNLIRCVGYDPTGSFLGVGFENGCVRILDALTLIDENPEPFRYSRDAVTHVTFSHDSKWMATADADYCVTVYKAESPNSQEPWIYMGKHRAHYKHIKGITFGVALDSGASRLLSLGEDRSLVEYNLKTVAKDHLEVMSTDRIEQSAVPQCFAWYPPITKEQFFITANNQFKFKLFNTTTKMCRRTTLAPTYGSPIQQIAVLPSEDPVNDPRYMAYVTKDKVGLHKMPPDGNPHNAMALIAHPSGVTNLACSYDGKHVFTAGGTDYSVHMWDTHFNALEAAVKLGGDDLIPFYGLMEGGREGELFKELENYFYYAQIRSQGVDTMDTRQVSTVIPLSEIPFVMRAMGHYPSEQEVEDMLNEIKFSEYVDTGEYVTQIDLGTFIKLYVNHRPAFGISEQQLNWAFDILGYAEDETVEPEIERGELLELLQTKGEHMTEVEVAEYLTTLLGVNPEGGSSELGGYDSAGAQDILEDALPEGITASMFAMELLGFGGAAEPSEGTVSPT